MKNNTATLRVTLSNPSSRKELIERSLPLVKSLTARLRARHGLSPSFDELYALGVQGLLQAADRFDPSRGVTFITFAYYRVRGTILNWRRYLPDQLEALAPRAAMTAVPRECLHMQAANDNGRMDGRSESPTEHLRWPFAETASVHLTSLDEIGSLPDESAPRPDDEVERRRVAERVAIALAKLPEIERRVVELHYYEELSFSEIGAKLGICKPWAFRLHNKALRQLREKLAELDDADDMEACG